MGAAPLTLAPGDPLAKSLFPAPANICSAGLEAIVPKGRKNASTRRHNNDSIEMEVKTATWPVWTPCPSESTKKGVTVLAGVTDPDYQGEVGLLVHHGGKEEYVWNTGAP